MQMQICGTTCFVPHKKQTKKNKKKRSSLPDRFQAQKFPIYLFLIQFVWYGV
jgi:hypothetical protein